MKKKVTKPCKRCGKIMWNVTSYRTYCDACIKVRRQERLQQYQEQFHKPKADAPRKKAMPIKYIKSIEQCTREADALGLTYGQYVARGLDKE